MRVLILILLLALPGCVSKTQHDLEIQSIRQEMIQVQVQLLDLNDKMQSTQMSVKAATRTAAKVDKAVADAAKAVKTATAAEDHAKAAAELSTTAVQAIVETKTQEIIEQRPVYTKHE